MSPVSMSDVVLDVAQGLQDHEQRLVVDVELGPLVALDRVLDRQRVQLELVVDQRELGVGGVLQTDPDEAVRSARRLSSSLLQVVALEAAGPRGRWPGQRSQGSYHHAGPPAARTPDVQWRPCRSACWSVMAVRPRTRAGRWPAGPRESASTTPGRGQVEALGKRLASCRSRCSVSSPLQRCQETAVDPRRRARRAHRRHGGGPGGVPLRRVDRWRAEGPGQGAALADRAGPARAPRASPTARSSPASRSPRCSCGRCAPSGPPTPRSPATTAPTRSGWRCRTATSSSRSSPTRPARTSTSSSGSRSTRPRCRWSATPPRVRS